MNRTLWKLDRIGERLWILATMTATQAATLGGDGKGIAIVADETRILANKINHAVEQATMEGEALNKEKIMPLAFQLNLLALNSAIESSHRGYQGKHAAIYAEEVRNLAYEIVCLFDEATAKQAKNQSFPWPPHVMSTVNRSCEFLQFDIGGIPFVEALDNIKEICGPVVEQRNGHIMLRNLELPLINGYKLLGKEKEVQTYVIMYTPWAEQNKTYAVAADVSGIFYCPIGKPMDAPSQMPLSKYVRECWENENGEPFYFMDWTQMTESNPANA